MAKGQILGRESNIITKTMPQGNKTIEIESPRISTNSILSFYTSVYGFNPNNVEVQNGKVIITFANTTDQDVEVGVQVNG